MPRHPPRLRRPAVEPLEARQLLALTPQMLVDINQLESSNPHNFAEFDGRLYYAAEHADFGTEVWSTDGTPEGTSMLTDIAPLAASSTPVQFTPLGDWLYFSAFNWETGRELWRTDGTAAGTTVFDLNPGDDDALGTSEPMVVAGGYLYFMADDGGGEGLWRTNGSAAPTLVKRVTSTLGFSSLIAVGSDVYFRANDAQSGNELWKSDGTEVGTQRVKDITPGTSSSTINDQIAFGGKLYFTVNDRLWTSDGTSAGTVQVMTSPALAGLRVYEVAALDGELYLLAGNNFIGKSLWRTNGTDAGTELVFDAEPQLGSDGRLTMLTAVDERLHFLLESSSQLTLWTSDGTVQGTQPVQSFDPTLELNLRVHTELNGDLYFATNSAFAPALLWKTDGTPDGTVVISEIGPRQTAPSDLLAVGGRVYFSARIGDQGEELWSTDGTPGILTTPGQPPADSDSSLPSNFVTVGNKLYFTANDGYGEKLWISDGMPDDAQWLFAGRGISQLTPVGDLLYFTSLNAAGRRILVVTDGTLEGTIDFTSSIDPAYEFYNLTDVRGQLYFTMNQPGAGTFFGVAEGASLVFMHHLGFGERPQIETTAVTSDAFYFILRNSSNGSIWRTDGTQEGTFTITSLLSAPTILEAREVAAIGDDVYFTARNHSAGAITQIWKTNGTPEGTALVTNATAQHLTAAGGKLFYERNDWPSDRELWMLDVSSPGPQLVAPLLDVVGFGGPETRLFAELNGAIYFLNRTPATGFRPTLWRTTGPGDITKIAELSSPFDLNVVALAGSLYFGSGLEFYKSDGTTQGTHLLPFIGPYGLLNSGLAALGDTLYFAGSTGGGEPAYLNTSSQFLAAHLFYNDSTFDQENPDLNVADFGAIATDKTPYRAGDGPSTFANVSSYTRGINGVMLDFAFLGAELTAEDFVFRVGNSNDPANWDVAPAPQAIVTAKVPGPLFGAFGDFTERVSIAWANGDILNTWLEITVLANDRTGLLRPEVFYFGSKAADSGTPQHSGVFVTTPTDSVQLFSRLGPNKPVTDPLDYNRDGQVSPTDSVLVFHNVGQITRLNLSQTEIPQDTAPSSVGLLAASDTGISSSDRITRYNNSSPETTLIFEVTGTVPGALVTVYADGLPLTSIIATGTISYLSTAGDITLADGLRNITARQTLPAALESDDSPALVLTIDTQAPTASFVPVDPDPIQTAVSSLGLNFDEAVFGLDRDAFWLGHNGNGNLLTPAQTVTTLDNVSWLLGNLAELTVATGIYDVYFQGSVGQVTDAAGNLAGEATESFTKLAHVVARHLFYNQSRYDGSSAVLDFRDDAAIAPDKSPYFAGSGLATFASVSSYSRGINGLMIDIAGASSNVSASDFLFRVGNNNDPGSWTAAPPPTQLIARPGFGQGGSMRIAIAWANTAIINEWLEVTVLPTQNTGLAEADVFYFGSKAADSGTGAGPHTFDTTTTDSVQIFSVFGPNKSITDPRDYNRDGAVTVVDSIMSFVNMGSIIRLDLPATVPTAEPAAAPQLATSQLQIELDRNLAFALAADTQEDDSAAADAIATDLATALLSDRARRGRR